MSRPRLLDLFCGAGGAAMGYHRAGFDVLGVDLVDQPNYPFEFVRSDALALLRHVITCTASGVFECEVYGKIDAIHASPPCQFATAYRRRPGHVADSRNLIPATRGWLDEGWNYHGIYLPYIIENVEQAREHLRDPITLCGSSFGLEVRRHRLFESNIFMMGEPRCDHASQQGDWPQATNRKNRRRTCEVGVWRIPLEDQKRAMGVDWDCTLHELSQMVPPAYTEWIGTQLLASLEAA